jgi:hypothetical protein
MSEILGRIQLHEQLQYTEAPELTSSRLSDYSIVKELLLQTPLATFVAVVVSRFHNPFVSRTGERNTIVRFTPVNGLARKIQTPFERLLTDERMFWSCRGATGSRCRLTAQFKHRASNGRRFERPRTRRIMSPIRPRVNPFISHFLFAKQARDEGPHEQYANNRPIVRAALRGFCCPATRAANRVLLIATCRLGR